MRENSPHRTPEEIKILEKYCSDISIDEVEQLCFDTFPWVSNYDSSRHNNRIATMPGMPHVHVMVFISLARFTCVVIDTRRSALLNVYGESYHEAFLRACLLVGLLAQSEA